MSTLLLTLGRYLVIGVIATVLVSWVTALRPVERWLGGKLKLGG